MAIALVVLLLGAVLPALTDGSARAFAPQHIAFGQAHSCALAGGGAGRIVPSARAVDVDIVAALPLRQPSPSYADAVVGAVAAARIPLHRLLRVYLI